MLFFGLKALHIRLRRNSLTSKNVEGVGDSSENSKLYNVQTGVSIIQDPPSELLGGWSDYVDFVVLHIEYVVKPGTTKSNSYSCPETYTKYETCQSFSISPRIDHPTIDCQLPLFDQSSEHVCVFCTVDWCVPKPQRDGHHLLIFQRLKRLT